jgi:hypothetical protein
MLYGRLGGPITLRLLFLDPQTHRPMSDGEAQQSPPQQQWQHASLAFHGMLRLFAGIFPAAAAGATATGIEAALLSGLPHLHGIASPAHIDTPSQV